MHIVVCVKQVPDTTQVRVDPDTNTLIREGIPTIVNPYDLHAIEAAVALKERYGGRVTALCMGPKQAREALREAVSMGSDEGVLLSDRAFAGSDTLATSYILSEAIKRMGRAEPVDLVLCGKQSIDGDTAQVGPGIAVRLGFTQLTYVTKVREMDEKGRRAVVERHLEDGTQVVDAELPALMTITKEANKIRYAPLPFLIKAARYEPEVWTQAEMQLDADRIGLKGSPTAVRKIFAPPARSRGEIISHPGLSVEGVVKELLERLRSEGVLE